jgi:uncharacterized protein (TIGR02646 family)
MHKLDRSAVPIPNCLNQSGKRYGDLRGVEKEAIRTALLEIQGHRCAYCERRTGADQDDGHIEHFRNQADHTELDLVWSNLFWSCKDEKTCGKHKDKCTKESGRLKRFDHDDIIDPAAEDPEVLLLFVFDGTVRHKDGLNERDRHRAQETLRVFQLADSPYLRKSRQDAVSPYISAVDAILNISSHHVEAYVRGELSKLETIPFSTTIKSFLMSVIQL